LIPLADERAGVGGIARACGSVADVEATYLVILIVTFLAIAAFAGYVLLKLFAGQR
jgi:glycerol-3-phosphate acyltransferase PlsY